MMGQLKHFQFDPKMDHIEQNNSQANSTLDSTKPSLGSKMAIERRMLRNPKLMKEAFKMASLAQKIMVETSLQRLRVLQTETFMNMIMLPSHHLDRNTTEFLREAQ